MSSLFRSNSSSGIDDVLPYIRKLKLVFFSGYLGIRSDFGSVISDIGIIWIFENFRFGYFGLGFCPGLVYPI